MRAYVAPSRGRIRLVGSPVGRVLSVHAPGGAGPARTLTVTFLIPVFAVAYGALLLGETITLWMVGCGAVILIGVALSSGLIDARRWRLARRPAALP